MAYADVSTYRPDGDGSIIGQFIEEEFGIIFEFSENRVAASEDVQRFLLKGADWTNQFPHKVWVMDESNPMRAHDQGFRYAKVMKTRAHVVVGEDENGPVIEVWKFKNAKRNVYPEL